VGPTWVNRVGKVMLGDKNIMFFGRNVPQIAVFIIVPPFLSSRNLTGGSGVRGKAGPNWVRKVFNCLRSL
jgi:hypothetical protein